jgi:hypothetical protein
MLYDRGKKEIYEGQHPLKLYEYAAAGLPTLSTYHREFDSLQPPILHVNTENEVQQALEQISKNPLPWIKKMIAFSEEHSWQNCLNKAKKHLLIP